jgi:hypothetical protein
MDARDWLDPDGAFPVDDLGPVTIDLLINHRFSLHDNAMGPRYEEGDVILFDVHGAVGLGDLLAVWLDGQPAIRWLVAMTRQRATLRVGPDPHTPSQPDVSVPHPAILGRVCGATRWMHYVTEEQRAGNDGYPSSFISGLPGLAETDETHGRWHREGRFFPPDFFTDA